MGHFRYLVPLYDAKPLPEVEISSMGMSEIGHFDPFPLYDAKRPPWPDPRIPHFGPILRPFRDPVWDPSRPLLVGGGTLQCRRRGILGPLDEGMSAPAQDGPI